MKRFLIALTVLFIVNVGCKKENIGGGGLCACSPVVGPELNLTIKTSAGADLLSSQTIGAYTKDKISMFRKDADGKEIVVGFDIRPPFDYGNSKFTFNSLHVYLYGTTTVDNTLYLKLGSKVYTLNIQVATYKLDKLLIDSKEAEKDKTTLANYVTMFYLTE